MDHTGIPYLIRCTSCHTKNRIAADKINANPKCGRCGLALNLTGIFIGQAVNISEMTFDTEVLQSPIPVIVFFWATWCSICRSVMPIMERIADKLRGHVKVAKVNIEQNKILAARFQVFSVPMMLIFDDGKLKETIIGASSELQILQKLAPYF